MITVFFVFMLVIQLSTLLGKRGRLLKDLTDYWDVASFFELHAIKSDWMKACLGALHMYLLNPPIWYLKSTINNLQILHQARQIRDRRPNSDQVSSKLAGQDIYSFWIDFFRDGIKSASSSVEERELPAEVPVSAAGWGFTESFRIRSILDSHFGQLRKERWNKIRNDLHRSLSTVEFSYGQRTGNADHTNSRTAEMDWTTRSSQDNRTEVHTINHVSFGLRSWAAEINVMFSSPSHSNDKQDNRSIFFFAFENSETFSSVELQIFFSSAGRRTAYVFASIWSA